MHSGKKSGISIGTLMALTMLVLTVGGSLWVLIRLSGGNVDLAAVSRNILKISGSQNTEPAREDIRINDPDSQTSSSEKKKETVQQAAGGNTGTETGTPQEGRFRLTVAGMTAVEENIRKSCYSQDSQKYDFSDVMHLLSGKNDGDIRAVFLENILQDDAKVSSIVIPENAADMLKAAGFNTVLCGFSRVFDRGEEGILSTGNALKQAGMLPLGILDSAEERAWRILQQNGVSVAMMQYTATVSAATRRNMEKKGISGMVPEADPDKIAEDIRQARADGADAVIVFLNWGREGAKSPDKTQIQLASRIADAGADLIVGSGSRVAHQAEILETSDGSGRKILCIYSLGTLLSDNRKQLSRMAGMLLHVEFKKTGEHRVTMEEAGYSPTYAWRYKQDGKYFYRCLCASELAPDGMESDQIQSMEKADALLTTLLEGSPLLP